MRRILILRIVLFLTLSMVACADLDPVLTPQPELLSTIGLPSITPTVLPSPPASSIPTFTPLAVPSQTPVPTIAFRGYHSGHPESSITLNIATDGSTVLSFDIVYLPCPVNMVNIQFPGSYFESGTATTNEGEVLRLQDIQIRNHAFTIEGGLSTHLVFSGSIFDDGSARGTLTYSSPSVPNFATLCDTGVLTWEATVALSDSAQPTPLPTYLIHMGRIAYVAEAETVGICAVSAETAYETCLTPESVRDVSPAWSPDGQYIAFASAPTGEWHDIYVMNADGTNRVRLTNNQVSDREPAWSPDGKFIAFVSYRDGNDEIYVMNADGTNPRRLTFSSAQDWSPSWSPEGDRIVFVSSHDYQQDIYVMNTDGSNQIRLTQQSGSYGDPVWSPDGDRIAYSSGGFGSLEVYVMNSDGTDPTPLTSNGVRDMDPAWSPDGTRIAFCSERDGEYEIYIMNADGSEQIRLTYNRIPDVAPTWAQ